MSQEQQATQVRPREERQEAPLVGADTALVPSAQQAGVVGTALAAQAMAEVRLAMEMAIARPRNEDGVMTRIARVCKRPRFAEKALYAIPRGKDTIVGPSVHLAQEMGKLWGNLRFGAFVVMDADKVRSVRCWAWDLETNAKKELDVTFDKLVYRKGRGYVEATDQDLLELSNRNASKGVRNCILGLLPWDLVDDATEWCKATQLNEDAKDPDARRKAMLLRFSEHGIGGSEIVAYVGKPLDMLTPADLTRMTAVYNAIRSGEQTWQDFVGKLAEEEGVQGARPSTADELRRRVKAQAEAMGQPGNGGKKQPTNQGGGK